MVRGSVELILAVAAAVGGAVSWMHVRYQVVVAPVIDGEPATISVSYHPPMVLLAWMLVTLAAVLAVVACARVRRALRSPERRYPVGVSSSG